VPPVCIHRRAQLRSRLYDPDLYICDGWTLAQADATLFSCLIRLINGCAAGGTLVARQVLHSPLGG